MSNISQSYLFREHNQLIILLKSAMDMMPFGDHKIVIRAYKTSLGQQVGRLNTIDEVAIRVVAIVVILS